MLAFEPVFFSSVTNPILIRSAALPCRPAGIAEAFLLDATSGEVCRCRNDTPSATARGDASASSGSFATSTTAPPSPWLVREAVALARGRPAESASLPLTKSHSKAASSQLQHLSLPSPIAGSSSPPSSAQAAAQRLSSRALAGWILAASFAAGASHGGAAPEEADQAAVRAQLPEAA